MVKQTATKKDYTKFTLDAACAHIKMMDGKQTVGWRLEYIPANAGIDEHWRLTREVFGNQMSGIVKQIQ
jgi:hypothetical protein